MNNSNRVPRQQTDVEINRREYNGFTILLIEDQKKEMMINGTSRQYILAIERTAPKTGTKYPTQKRYISNLIKKKGFENVKEGAYAIFLRPMDFRSILGEEWGK